MQKSLPLLMLSFSCLALGSCKDVPLGADGVAGRGGGGGNTVTGGSTGIGGTTVTGGSTGIGGTTGATGGTTSSAPDCALVGCSEPPLCSEGCTAPCGCCFCTPGERRGDLICTKSGCYAQAVAPDAGILLACSGQGDPLCGQASSCITGCPSKGGGGLCSVAGREMCGCGIIDQPCTTPGLECLYPSCCDYQGLCLTPAERQAVCSGPLAAQFNCTPAVGNPDAGVDAWVDGRMDAAIDVKPTDGLPGIDSAASSCENPLPLRCGDRLNHSTLVQGRANVWVGYGVSQRWESGPETIYAFQTPATCQVVARLKNLTVDLDLFLMTSCDPRSSTEFSSTPLDLQTIETVGFTSQPGQPYFVVVDGYDGVAGSYTLEVDCTCNQDAGAVDAPPADAQGDTGIAPGCDPSAASAALTALSITPVGTPQTLNATLPAVLATDDNWGLKATVCRQAGYDITALAGKTVCLLGQDMTQVCQGIPATAWVVMNNGAVACVYKSLRQGFRLAPGVYAANDANCVQPTIAAGASVLCGQTCTSANGPCCPTTTMMDIAGGCSPKCQRPAITCDGPEDCPNGDVCCSLESTAGGFAGASCVGPAECTAPSRVICHQQADCLSSQQCGVPNPMPAYVPAFPYPVSVNWSVFYQVCAP